VLRLGREKEGRKEEKKEESIKLSENDAID
jgi:hypothetical protein